LKNIKQENHLKENKKTWVEDQIECDRKADESEKSQDVDKGQDGKFVILEEKFTLNGEIISKKYEV